MIELHAHPDGIREIRLARPPVNALNPELLARLREAIDAAPAEGAQGVVLSGSPGLFSAGLDVPTLLTLGRDELEAAWRAFFGVCTALAQCPLPCAAAITGHSPAGGAVLSLYCDYRVMAEGSFRIGLNEVQVGLVVPEPIQFAFRRLLGAHRAERMLVAGAMVESEEALRIGFVDRLAPVDGVVARAVDWLRATLALPRSAMLRTRRLARADLVDAIGTPETLDLRPFVEAWFEPETQGVLRAMVARLKAKS
jgi:Delta3-Delta2-enoyl-CoA isomerase